MRVTMGISKSLILMKQSGRHWHRAVYNSGGISVLLLLSDGIDAVLSRSQLPKRITMG